MLETLLKLGLSEKEGKVYLAALELGEDTAQNIAKKAGVNRATTYVILEKLMRLGLMSSQEREKKTLFVAENPTELVNILEEEKRQVDARKKYLDEAMNQLTAIYNANKSKPIVRYFEGPDGLEALDRYKVDLKPNTEMLTMIPIDKVEELFPSRRKTSLSERVKLGIKAKAIYTRKEGEFSEEENAKQLREGIFLSREDLPIDATITIHPEWGVKLYYFNQSRPYGVLIQSPEIARNMKHLFDLAWRGAKQKTEK